MRLVRTGRSLALAVVVIAGGAFAATAWPARAVQIQTGRAAS